MSATSERKHVHLTLGSTAVRCVAHGPADAELLLVNLHEDEAASMAAGMRVLSVCRARLYHFEARGTRLLYFEHDGQALAIDPNRIFSPPGIEATLARHNAQVPDDAAREVASFAEAYRALLAPERARAVIALHNTRDDYCVHSYAPGGEQVHNAAAVWIAPDQHRHDFFFVTERQVYEALRQRGFNVVLQDEHPADDGSLSVYCRRLEIPYVNVEARFDAVDDQTEMLLQLIEVMQLQPDG